MRGEYKAIEKTNKWQGKRSSAKDHLTLLKQSNLTLGGGVD